MKSLILGLDCSGETYSAGLLVDEINLTTIEGFSPRSALRELPQQVGRLLHDSKRTYGELSAVGVTSGPGSFTGVRLGVCLAKTVALVADCQIAELDTLEVLAAEAAELFQHNPGPIAVALDARRAELYCGVFGSGGVLLETAVRTPEEFLAYVADLRDLRACVGPGFSAYPHLVPTQFSGPVWASRAQAAPSSATVCSLTLAKWRAGELTNFAVVEPRYYRQADIQVQQVPAP